MRLRVRRYFGTTRDATLILFRRIDCFGNVTDAEATVLVDDASTQRNDKNDIPPSVLDDIEELGCSFRALTKCTNQAGRNPNTASDTALSVKFVDVRLGPRSLARCDKYLVVA